MGKITIPKAAKTRIGVPSPPAILALFAHIEVSTVLMLIPYNFQMFPMTADNATKNA
ncbi:hypothetical protein [Psychromonas aquimarina]|uniref:hypothetical protein n=1 Tax=Psychromonas aquimarina TaxID=444919 RepID=UPI00041B7607|nr:hypothetical protein [Psychromonas aquimarina]